MVFAVFQSESVQVRPTGLTENSSVSRLVKFKRTLVLGCESKTIVNVSAVPDSLTSVEPPDCTMV